MITGYGEFYIYRHIRLDTNIPFYIGIGTKNYKRDTYKCNYVRARQFHKGNIIWKRIVDKINYIEEILLESDNYEFLLEKEIEFIKLYGRINKNTGSLANLTDGGEGTRGAIHSEETKQKIREIVSSRPPKSEETRRKIGDANRGLIRSEEFKRRISNKLKGFKHLEETKKKISQSLKGKKRKESIKQKEKGIKERKPVLQFTKKGEFIREWESISSVSTEGFSGSKVSACCNKKQVLHRKFKWEFKIK